MGTCYCSIITSYIDCTTSCRVAVSEIWIDNCSVFTYNVNSTTNTVVLGIGCCESRVVDYCTYSMYVNSSTIVGCITWYYIYIFNFSIISFNIDCSTIMSMSIFELGFGYFSWSSFNIDCSTLTVITGLNIIKFRVFNIGVHSRYENSSTVTTIHCDTVLECGICDISIGTAYIDCTTIFCITFCKVSRYECVCTIYIYCSTIIFAWSFTNIGTWYFSVGTLYEYCTTVIGSWFCEIGIDNCGIYTVNVNRSTCECWMTFKCWSGNDCSCTIYIYCSTVIIIIWIINQSVGFEFGVWYFYIITINVYCATIYTGTWIK